MKIKKKNILNSLLGVVISISAPAWAFDSGSTGADGAFSPTVDTTLTLPPNGIFNFTTVNIPQGVTVKFARNAANTPAVVLAQGDVVIDGIIDISGVDGGVIAVSPPGGFDGGRAVGPNSDGANGLGPGAGVGGLQNTVNGGSNTNCGGAGAGYGSNGLGDFGHNACASEIVPGIAYGSDTLQPLLGGSGGGSGANGSLNSSSGAGGGGGGALLIASTTTLTLNGQILASGGGGENTPAGSIGAGGGGSGGGVRLVATSLAGSGNISVDGGVRGNSSNSSLNIGSSGGYGRVRLEAETFNFNGTVIPSAALVATALPLPVFVSNIPTIRITMVGGRTVPAVPTGFNDVSLPASTTNPVTVEFEASNVPVGDMVRLTVTPTVGPITTATSTALAGSLASSTASVDVDLPAGASVLTASVSFTAAAVNDFSPFASGEQVAKVDISQQPGQPSETVFTTVSGRKYHWAGNLLVAVNLFGVLLTRRCREKAGTRNGTR